MSESEEIEYGPARVVCPYCGDEFEVEAGPTKLCEVTHCRKDEWIIVDLRTGKAGRATSWGETHGQ